MFLKTMQKMTEKVCSLPEIVCCEAGFLKLLMRLGSCVLIGLVRCHVLKESILILID